MTIQDIKQSFGACGLACALCNGCAGCRRKAESCGVKACCAQKGLQDCFACNEWPCHQDVHKSLRARAFHAVAKAEGPDQLAAYLYTNEKRGIAYHRAGGLTGDYDSCKTEQAVIDLLKNGRLRPYEICPAYESARFILRLVSVDDAADLLACYQSPTVSVQANSADCGYGYDAQTVEEMRRCIERWLEEYRCRQFVRFSIIEKQKRKAVGTVELFDGGHRGRGVLRIDLLPAFESGNRFDEILRIADCFFSDFGVDTMVTKAVTGAVDRIDRLTRNGYAPWPGTGEWKPKDAYIKTRP